jgi:hypothetical protein
MKGKGRKEKTSGKLEVIGIKINTYNRGKYKGRRISGI